MKLGPPLSLCFTIPFQLQSGKNRVLITRTGHRYPPKRFQEWRAEVMKCLPPIAGPYLGPMHLIVDYVPGDLRKRDVPGMLDALLHVLERGGYVVDDAQIRQVTWTPFPIDRQHPRCTVTLSPLTVNLDEEQMMAKKPDKFERDVDSLIHGSYPMADTCVTRNEAVTLLRQYHAEVVAMVQNEKVSGETGTEGDIAYNQALDDVLAKLKELAK